MGNEASLEGGGQPGEPGSAAPTAAAPGSISAPAGSGQLIKPSNGAPAGGGPAAGPGPGITSVAGKPGQMEHPPGAKPGAPPGDSKTGAPYRLATHESPTPQPTTGPGEGQAQGQGQHAARRTLQVDVGSAGKAGTGRSPAVSPGSAPTSPYSVPQIAPMPSSKLCPVCNTTELTNQDPPNANTCTQCHNTVCNQCGFNPNPHLTQVQEWLCLNCQMQRALGMDMTTPTPRSKSQQQLPDLQAPPPTEPKAPPPAQPTPQASPGPQKQAGPLGRCPATARPAHTPATRGRPPTVQGPFPAGPVAPHPRPSGPHPQCGQLPLQAAPTSPGPALREAVRFRGIPAKPGQHPDICGPHPGVCAPYFPCQTRGRTRQQTAPWPSG
ncbi:hypothetical protein AGOR_G00152500 [Albula goreensis]|uniref:Zinc finger piccolo-type domain-containing protein n=1 Tax=Albula goreensis TaxID=1534307 RepID=A0A8T3D6L3_9TELE|nr:hypothetical protein AGOR_G00152500 [Albula goreensis]